MAEFETITMTNPMKQNWVGRFNGEAYELKAGKEVAFPQFIAYHLAWHLSGAILGERIKELKQEDSANPYRPEIGQLINYDNAQRRIALYDILGSKERVEECMKTRKLKGFIGSMAEYDEYVAKKEKPKTTTSASKSDSKS